MHRPRPAIDVRGTDEFNKLYLSLPKESKLRIEISESFQLLREDCTRGENIEKVKIGYFINKYSVNNAWRYELKDGARMIYTIVSDPNGLVVIILKIFSTHDEYEKHLGY